VKILIDTHIFLWMLSCPEKLNKRRRYELESRSNEIFLSAMSIAELMIKQSIGKLHIDFDPIEMAEKTGVEVMPFSPQCWRQMSGRGGQPDRLEPMTIPPT